MLKVDIISSEFYLFYSNKDAYLKVRFLEDVLICIEHGRVVKVNG